MRRDLLLASLLAVTAACGDDPPPRLPPAPQLPAKPQGPSGRSGETVELGPSAAGKTKTITVGDRVLVELDGPALGIAPDHQWAYGNPEVTGDAVRYVNREDKAPPPDIDGGHITYVFELRAVRSGRSKLKVPIVNEGKKADAEAFELEFTVANPD